MKPDLQTPQKFRLRLVRSACLWALTLMISFVVVDPPRLVLGWVLAVLAALVLAAGAFTAHGLLTAKRTPHHGPDQS